MFKPLLLTVLFTLFFIKQLFSQVDLPTGRAVADFPIFSYNNGDKLTTAINLVYTGGNGIKVNELASNVGLGFGLQAGGVISRIKIGVADDQVGGKLNGDLLGTGRAYSSYANSPVPSKAGWVPIQDYAIPFYSHDSSVIDDREMDVFTYNYNGRQGSFVVGLNGTIKPLNNANIRIEKVTENLSSSNILTRWSKFIITDESGIKYTFSEKGLDRIILYQTTGQERFYFDPPSANLATYVCGQDYKITDYYAVNNWYLSEISDPLTNQKITFTYEDYELEYIAGLDASYSIDPLDGGQQQIVAQKIEPRFKGITKRLLRINMPENSQVQFSYYPTIRADLPGDKALQKIAIKRDSVEVMGYLFNYQYFSVTNLRDFNYAFTPGEAVNTRLCLKSFRKYGKNNVVDSPYVFTYNLGGPLGVPGRNTPAVDHYGYFNGGIYYPFDTDLHTYTNVQKLCIPHNRTVIGTISIMGAGTLTGIKYPKGGTLSYDYESNYALNGNTDVRTAGIRVKTVTQTDGINANNAIVKEYKYVLENGQSSGWGYEPLIYADTINSKLMIPTQGTYRAAHMAYAMALPVAETLLKGYAGLSLAGFSNYPSEKVIRIEQADNMYSNLFISLAIIAVTYIVRDAFSSNVKIVDLTTQKYFSSNAKNQNPLPSLYSRVEVYEGTSTDNIGKTVYEFTSDKDFTINFPDRSISNASKYRCIPWIYGLPKRKLIFNKGNELVKEQYSKYNAFVSEDNSNEFQSMSSQPNQYLITTAANFPVNAGYITFSVDKYAPLTGRAELAYTIEKEFAGPNCNLKRIDYEYDSTYYNVKKIITRNSLHEKTEQRLYYAYDYHIPGVMQLITDQHIFNMPVSSETWLYKDSAEEQLINANFTELQQVSSGAIRSGRTLSFAGNAPISKSMAGIFDPTKLVRPNINTKENAIYTYNTNGSLVSLVTDGRAATNIYNDGNDGIIATIANAGLPDIAYSSFEPGAKGNWTIAPTGSAFTSTTLAPSGSYCLTLSGIQSVLKSGLNTAKKYVLSYWKKNGSVNVSGGTKSGEVTGITRNGWTFCTMYISQATSLTLTGTALLDELRLYPAEASFTSNTYDNQLNVTSGMGADNIATYYEYDELGRLKNVYDADRNLTVSKEYKYKQ